ncbi:MAG: Nif3-like dinuclear metal center hexameric protein [Acidobacteriota bacterium]
MNIRDIFAAIEHAAPAHMAAQWDRCGVQVASPVTEVTRLAVALDATSSSVEKALNWGAQMVLTHHPLGKTPRLPDTLGDHRAVLKLLLEQDAWLVAAHTTLDCAPGGPAAWLADELGLTGRAIVDPQGVTPRVMALYREVATDGFEGLNLPDDIDIGRLHFDRDALRHAPQGFSCPETDWPKLRAYLDANEDVTGLAGVVRLAEPSEPFGYGLVGTLPTPLAWEGFLAVLRRAVPRSFYTFIGAQPDTVSTVAYCTGSGSSCAAKAFAKGADVFITGDVTHHAALDIEPLGLTIDVGHRSLEEEMMRRLAGDFAGRFSEKGLEVRFFPSADPMRAVLNPA